MIKSTTVKSLLLLICLLATTFTACSDDSDPVHELTISETLAVTGNLGELSQAIETAGLTDTLSSDGPITVFATVNNAFPDDLSGDELIQTLEYHIVKMNLTFENLKNLESAETLSGDSLYFSASNDTITINNGQAVITSQGVEASNGVVFVIDTVLTPPGGTK